MSHRFRLVPTPAQATAMAENCAHARFIWNLALEQANCWKRELGPTPNVVEQCRQLTEARAASEWLAAGSRIVQHEALRDFDQARRNWWHGSHNRPTWRKKGQHEGFAVRDVRVAKLSRKWATVMVPKVGAVRFRLSRSMPVKHGMGRVTLDRQHRWHIAFSAPQAPLERASSGRVVGLDRGVANTLATSDGEFLAIPKQTPAETAKRARLQRQLARRVKGSARREATKLRLARLTGTQMDRRKDWVEKTSTWLVRTYDVVVLEDLKVRNMLRSASGTVEDPGTNVAQKRGLNRSISEAAWTLLDRRICDKADASEGCRMVHVPAPGTSQTCSACGHRSPENRKSQAVFSCVACGHAEHADLNASKNIRAAGLAVLARGGADSRAVEPRTIERSCHVA